MIKTDYVIREVEPEQRGFCDPELKRGFRALESVIQMLYLELIDRGCDDEKTREQILQGSVTTAIKKAAQKSWGA